MIFKKNKFQLNENQLVFEEIKNQKSKVLFNLSAILIFLTIISLSIYLLTLENHDAYKLKKQELDELRKSYDEIASNLDLMQRTLDNLRERDTAIFKQIIELNPSEDEFSSFHLNSKLESIKKFSNKELGEIILDKINIMKTKLRLLNQTKNEITASVKTKEKLLKNIPSIRPVQNPNNKIEFISGFGYRKHPVFKIYKIHSGIDFGAYTGTAVYATANGTVSRVEFRKEGYGRLVLIDHGFGFVSLYSQLSEINVKVGQKVKKGQIVARVGQSGDVAPHLHYEIQFRNKRINPLHFCREGMSIVEYSTFIDRANKKNQALSIH
jgi:murein DD-endopeptidase MepM/ murein hydrolase activator NlpD